MMSIDQAISTWRDLSNHVTPQSLNNPSQHETVHEIMAAVRLAITQGRLTYEEFERRVAV